MFFPVDYPEGSMSSQTEINAIIFLVADYGL